MIHDPRYLNLFMNWILTPFGKDISSGSLVCSFASFREAGKNIASDLDLVMSDPRCMVSPKHEKCLFSMLTAFWSSFLF